MKGLILVFIFWQITIYSSLGKELHIGSGQTYSNLNQALGQVSPGDTIIFHEGVYNGGIYYANLQGTESEWITIKTKNNETAIIRGGNTAWQFSHAAYVWVDRIIFENQAVNGCNMDDGGDYSVPGHHLKFTNCMFRDMNASGNNDLLKMSGINDFEISNCQFKNGSAGGSGIDMVGCHNGVISNNYFENMGSNAIQAKGGTQYITIEKNFFTSAGYRSVNLGGSTGLQYFRPIDATFEAADMNVFSNIFVGSEAPIAYVGCTRVKVVNNTIYLPQKWVVRILQETVDESRFISCGDNYFQNNLIYQGNISTETNIGINTRPETFIYTNNFWYNYQQTSWSGPSIPVTDAGLVINIDPLFMKADTGNFNLQEESQAIATINNFTEPQTDFYGNAFQNPRSAGAIESGSNNTFINEINKPQIQFKQNYPNPFSTITTIEFSIALLNDLTFAKIKIYDILNREVATLMDGKIDSGNHQLIWDGSNQSSGIYFIKLSTEDFSVTKKMIICHY